MKWNSLMPKTKPASMFNSISVTILSYFHICTKIYMPFPFNAMCYLLFRIYTARKLKPCPSHDFSLTQLPVFQGECGMHTHVSVYNPQLRDHSEIIQGSFIHSGIIFTQTHTTNQLTTTHISKRSISTTI